VFIVSYMDSLQPAVDQTHGGQGASASSRGSAHDRLLEAATELAARDGYANLTVEKLLAVSGVSRATFYQYFCNVDDCFWSAYRQHAEQLVADVQAAAAGSLDRELEVLDALVETAVSRPRAARLLMREVLAAGATGRCERDALIARIEREMTGPAGHRSKIDLPPAILVGATFGFLAMRLAGGDALDDAREQVREWAGAFARPSSRPSWSARLAPALAATASRAPAGSGPVRPAGTPRERIMRAMAGAIHAKGYRDATVADIVAAAGVSRRSFYNEFPSKADAFFAAYEHAFQMGLGACTPAFFISAPWPERVWHSAQAFTGFLAREPLLSYLGFVECYAAGPRFALRVQDTHLAFTLFLEDGYQRARARSLSRACSTLIAMAIFELAFQGTRRNPGLYLRRSQPLAVYIALAPFLGLDEAGEFVTGTRCLASAGIPSAPSQQPIAGFPCDSFASHARRHHQAGAPRTAPVQHRLPRTCRNAPLSNKLGAVVQLPTCGSTAAAPKQEERTCLLR
jgi:AcrR family transcriptional regulator